MVQMTPHDRSLLALMGFEVVPDVDQPGLWVWTRSQAGRVLEGCEGSFPTAEQAWGDVVGALDDVRDDLGVSQATWDLWPAARRTERVQAWVDGATVAA